MTSNPMTIFTKPWKSPIPELGRMLQRLGTDGLELPVRPGYPVNPDNAARELPRTAQELAKYGQTIHSIAADPTEPIIAACGEAGVPIVRTQIRVADRELGYLATVEQTRRQYQQLVPALEKHRVTIGVQTHCNWFVGSAAGLLHAIGDFDPKHVAAVLDMGHCALVGEPEEIAIEIAWSMLRMVNFKNPFRMRVNGPEAEQAKWKIYWTTGRHGFASWPAAVKELKRRNYRGPICITAEYSDEEAVDRLVAEDLAYMRSLLGRNAANG